MHFLLLGASGRTGQDVLSTALTQGHTITALVREPSKITQHENLTLVQGTPLEPSDIEKAFSATSTPIDAVIITLAVPRASDSPFAKPSGPPNFLLNSVKNTLAAMRKHSVSRIIFMSVLSAGSSWQETPWLVKAMFQYTNMKYVLEEHNAVDALLRGSEGIEWTLIRPPMLKDGEVKAVREFGQTGKGIGMFDSITRASVAECLIRAAVEGKWMKEAVVVAN